MSVERIVVRGPKLRAAIMGALLARRWLDSTSELIVAPEPDECDEATVLARPGHERFHAELEIPQDRLGALTGAQPVLAVPVETDTGRHWLPFSPFGMPNSGVDFHHFWHRADSVEKQDDLTQFSLSLALAQSSRTPTLSELEKLPLELGLAMDRDRYANVMLETARSGGARIADEGREVPDHTDLLIDCRLSGEAPNWSDGRITIASDRDIPGLEWQVLAQAGRRLLGLMSRLGDCAHEQREYTRLAQAEAARIADMRALLHEDDPASTERDALKRKVDVCAACGRIPSEDHEVFSQPEWLAALWARGLRPRRSDRLAWIMPETDLLDWMRELQRQIAQLASRGTAA